MLPRCRTPAGALVVLAFTAGVTGCTSGAQSAQPTPPVRAAPAATSGATPSERAGFTPPGVSALPPKEGGPLTQLPECQPPPQPVQAEPVPGLVLPDGAIITSVERAHPLTTVRGYIADTPVNVRKYYQQRDDLDFSELEDEIYEAETLYTFGVHNTYVKAQATCATGSQLIAVVGPSGKNGPLPKVGGGSS